MKNKTCVSCSVNRYPSKLVNKILEKKHQNCLIIYTNSSLEKKIEKEKKNIQEKNAKK